MILSYNYIFISYNCDFISYIITTFIFFCNCGITFTFLVASAGLAGGQTLAGKVNCDSGKTG